MNRGNNDKKHDQTGLMLVRCLTHKHTRRQK